MEPLPSPEHPHLLVSLVRGAGVGVGWGLRLKSQATYSELVIAFRTEEGSEVKFLDLRDPYFSLSRKHM